MKCKRIIHNSISRHMGILPVLLVAAIALVLAVSVPAAWAEEFDEAEIFFELNNTDGDLGIHALIDGEAWRYLKIEDPKKRQMLNIRVKGRLRQQGLTEIFFESAEPTFDELDPEDFFNRFPEGEYTIKGKVLEGDKLESVAEITHVMPAPPEVYFMIDDNMFPAAEGCDAEDLPEFVVGEPVIIYWNPVAYSHPELGTSGVEIEVVNYEVVVEIDETPWKTSIILPPDATSFQVPSEILDLVEFDDESEAEIKFEVLVREVSFNQTAVESCFVIVE